MEGFYLTWWGRSLTKLFRISCRIGPSVNDCNDFDKDTQQNLCQWKKHQPVKKKKILPVKRNILPVKKYKNSAREKKKCAWKKQKKVCVKNTFCPWKNPKNEKKRFSRALFFFTGKKNNTGHNDTHYPSLSKSLRKKSHLQLCSNFLRMRVNKMVMYLPFGTKCHIVDSYPS